MRMMSLRRASLRRAMLQWFDKNARDLPWRQTKDPYHIWVSEVMLQQTQVSTVIPYFTRFITRFPTVENLASAPVDDVLKHWEGLGYYRRAHNLHKAAKIIHTQYDGVIPTDPETLLTLPGIGRYTAGAIASIAFGQPVPVLDGNVKRVISRLDDMEDNIDETGTQTSLWERAGELVDPERPGDFNEALMELGATICLPQNPACHLCPVEDLCLARQRGTQYERPIRNPRKRTPHFDVVAGVIWHGSDPQRFLISQRPVEGMLGGLWEFPGGKQQVGESCEQALERELMEELAIRVEVGKRITSIDHAYTHFRITLHAYHALHVDGEPQCLGVDDWRWVTIADLDAYAFARTDRRIIEVLMASNPSKWRPR